MPDRCEDLEPLGSAWLDDALEPAEAAAFDAHLTTCAACRDEVEALARTRALLRSMPVRRVPAGLLADVPGDAGDLTDSTVPAPPLVLAAAAPRRRTAPRAAAAALAVVGVLSGAAYSLGERPPEARTVAVPVDLFVADHVAQSLQGPVWSPVLVEATQ